MAYARLIIEQQTPSLNVEVFEYRITVGNAPGAKGADAVITAQSIGDVIAAADAKPVTADADLVGFSDSEDGDILKSLSFANLWTWIRGLADLVYQPLSTALSKITEAGGLPLWDGGAWPGGGGGDSLWTDIGPPIVATGAPYVTVQGLDNTYKKYRIVATGFYCSVSGEVRGEIESGGVWQTADYASQRSLLISSYFGAGLPSVPYMQLTNGNSLSTSPTASLEVVITDPSRTDVSCMVETNSRYSLSATAAPYINLSAGFWHGGLGAVTGIRLYHNSGTMFGSYQLQGSNRA